MHTIILLPPRESSLLIGSQRARAHFIIARPHWIAQFALLLTRLNMRLLGASTLFLLALLVLLISNIRTVESSRHHHHYRHRHVGVQEREPQYYDDYEVVRSPRHYKCMFFCFTNKLLINNSEITGLLCLSPILRTIYIVVGPGNRFLQLVNIEKHVHTW